jgi:cytochrome c biogenesis factor
VRHRAGKLLAYYEYGWGGWWFWDPVENASFMPWLVGTALIHSLAVTEKARRLQELDCAAGDCGLLVESAGTFLVRSGVLTSVHAFATDRNEDIFILAFLTVPPRHSASAESSATEAELRSPSKTLSAAYPTETPANKKCENEDSR